MLYIQCLGRCELNRFEDLGLIETCRFEKSDQVAMDYVFKQEAEIRVVGGGSQGVDTRPPVTMKSNSG